MKRFKPFIAAALIATFTASPFVSLAADAPKKTDAKKPYPLKTCLVSDEKLGEMGDPYVFTHEGQEIKLCCKSCLKDFNKDKTKYVKKMKEEAAKAKKG
jgi:hypothetical protein